MTKEKESKAEDQKKESRTIEERLTDLEEYCKKAIHYKPKQ